MHALLNHKNICEYERKRYDESFNTQHVIYFGKFSEFFSFKIFQGASLSELLSQTERKYIFFFNERSEIVKINGTGKIILIKGKENHFQTFRKAICKMA